MLPTPAADPREFTAAQKEYLQGFMAGVSASGQFPFVGQTISGQLTGTAAAAVTANQALPAPEPEVYGTPLSDLCKEERWKQAENPLDSWERLLAHARTDQIPDAENTYRFKTFGLFYVAPAQDSFMIRLRLPAGEVTSHQLRGLADIAEELGNGFCDLTTRANFQLREFRPRDVVRVLTRVQELGLTSRGAGADNIRNITATPTSGFDRDELIDVRPYARALHHYILNHRDLYGLPRKFNVAFDSGGAVSAAADTNDIGLFAVQVPEGTPDLGAGVYFRLEVGGITGHGDFSRDTGVLLHPDEVVPTAAAMLRVFLEHGDRTNRKKARLKYLLEKWGFEKFLAATASKLAFPLRKLPAGVNFPRRPVLKHGHVGVYRQAQPGRSYLGATVPAGRLSARQMRRVADLADHFGRGEVRLTVWQNFLIPHVPDSFAATVERSLARIGLPTSTNNAAAGIVACTGNRGCKYASADTKAHGIALGKALSNTAVDFPVNLHLTGCPHSCAQHYCGDIGGVATKLPDGREGYHIVIGGGMDQEQGIGREIFRGVGADELPPLIQRILRQYKTGHQSGETFTQWARRHSIKELQEQLSA
jgi:ferredoxin-nitrite reductase